MTTTGNQTTVQWRVIDDARPLAAATRRQEIALPAESAEVFRRDGVVAFPGAFRDWVEPLRVGLQRTLDEPERYAFPCESAAPGEPGRFFDAYCNWQLVPEYLAFVLSSAAASLAGQVMGSRSAQLFHEHAFCKEAGTTKATPWHHDLPYYCIDGRQTASVYVALDDIPAEIAVRFWAGSHRGEQLFLPRDFAAGSEYDTADPSMLSVPDVDAVADPSEIVGGALAPGDAYGFDFRTLHGAGDAPVAGRRRAFSTRWLGDDVTYRERPGETSPPLTGLGLRSGDRMREDWFPVLWTA
jgi:ectoine hydroxylase-related dioxygenase (phytanoyl-CoA dioxygenase family)